MKDRIKIRGGELFGTKIEPFEIEVPPAYMEEKKEDPGYEEHLMRIYPTETIAVINIPEDPYNSEICRNCVHYGHRSCNKNGHVALGHETCGDFKAPGGVDDKHMVYPPTPDECYPGQLDLEDQIREVEGGEKFNPEDHKQTK